MFVVFVGSLMGAMGLLGLFGISWDGTVSGLVIGLAMFVLSFGRGGLENLNTGDKWHFCSQSAFLPFTRRDHDETSTLEP